jgi:hypothetical protein
MPDPVAWKVIEKGWPVYDAAAAQIGTVHELAGDENADIFDGLGVKESRLGTVKYVPAEVVASILQGEVHLSIAGDAVAALGDLHTAAEEEIIPERSTWYQRLAWWLTGRDR